MTRTRAKGIISFSISVLRSRRMTAPAVALAQTIGLPSSAKAGLLDDLFGLSGPRQAVAPSLNETSRTNEPNRETGRPVTHISTIKRSAPTGRSHLQKSTTIMSDKTLRPGDAVMSEHGLEIYTGPVADRHKQSQFVTLAEARLPQVARSALADKVPTSQRAAEPIATGRSVVKSRSNDH